MKKCLFILDLSYLCGVEMHSSPGLVRLSHVMNVADHVIRILIRTHDQYKCNSTYKTPKTSHPSYWNDSFDSF